MTYERPQIVSEEPIEFKLLFANCDDPDFDCDGGIMGAPSGH